MPMPTDFLHDEELEFTTGLLPEGDYRGIIRQVDVVMVNDLPNLVLRWQIADEDVDVSDFYIIERGHPAMFKTRNMLKALGVLTGQGKVSLKVADLIEKLEGLSADLHIIVDEEWNRNKVKLINGQKIF